MQSSRSFDQQAPPQAQEALSNKLFWCFRIALFMEFVGHGAFGVLTKKAWVPYITAFGFPEAWAWYIMPVVGTLDITLGFIALLSPRPIVFAWMAFWGCMTAALRPLTGESIWEFFERSYNMGVPFLALYFVGFFKHGIFARVHAPKTLPTITMNKIMFGFRIIIASMLIGHGCFGAVVGKPNLIGFYKASGFESFGLPLTELSMYIGLFEIGLGIVSLFVNWVPFFFFVMTWKLATEGLYVPAKAYGAWWEVIERGSSYFAAGMMATMITFQLKHFKAALVPRLISAKTGVNEVFALFKKTGTAA